MKVRQLFDYWRNELKNISLNVNIEENILDENTDEEEFYFYLDKQNNTCFYVFNDNWGIGLGIHYSDTQTGHLWFLEDLGIVALDKQLDFISKILKDVLQEERLFIDVSDHETHIDLTKYKDVNVKPFFNDGKHYSITEINSNRKSRLTTGSS